MIKIILYLVIFILLFSCRENSGNREGPPMLQDTITIVKAQDNFPEAMTELKNVDDIRKEHAYIISLLERGTMKTESFNYNCNEEKKGRITYFYEKGQLRLIRHTYNAYSHFSGIDEYYIKDEGPFFVFYNHLSWNFIDQNKTEDKITERRFYILNRKAVQCLEKKYKIITDEKDPTKPNEVPSKEIECVSIETVLENFELLNKLREQEEEINCLEE